ncbi:hypothetical protein FQZ97_849990 [compost metagenome]
MLVCIDCNFELGTNAIIGCDEYRVGKACSLEIEQAAETANFTIGTGTARGADKRLDLVDHQVARIDVDASFCVSQSIFLGGVIFCGHHLLLKLA